MAAAAAPGAAGAASATSASAAGWRVELVALTDESDRHIPNVDEVLQTKHNRFLCGAAIFDKARGVTEDDALRAAVRKQLCDDPSCTAAKADLKMETACSDP